MYGNNYGYLYNRPTYGNYGYGVETATPEDLQRKLTQAQYLAVGVIGLYALTFFIAMPLMARSRRRRAAV